MPVIPWSTTGTLSYASSIYRILITPNNYIFVAGDDGGTPFGYVWKSINGGTSWSAVIISTAQRCYDLTYKDNNTLFVSTREYPSNACSAAKSINSGTSWSDLTNPASFGEGYCILYDNNNSMLYIGHGSSTSHIYRSINEGSTWLTSHTFATANANPRQFCQYGNYIYVITEIGKIFKSLSGSDSWSQLSALTGISTGYTVYVEDSLILVGGKDTSSIPCIWKSINDGSTWSKIIIAPTATGNNVRQIIKVGNYYCAVVNNDDVYASLDCVDWKKIYLTGTGNSSVLGCCSGNYLYSNRSTIVYKGNASELFLPVIPQNVTCTPSTLKNTLSWDAVSDADSYIAYWTKSKIKNEYFKTDLSRWSQITNGQGETATITSEQLVLDVPDGVDGLIRLDSLFNINTGNTILEIDLKSYLPDDPSNGVTPIFGMLDSGPLADYALIFYWTTNSGNTHNIQVVLRDNSTNYPTVTTIVNQPTKFRFTRTRNYVTLSAYTVGTWYDIASRDYGLRANNLIRANLQLADRSLHGGSCIFDNLIIRPSIKEFNGESSTENFDNLDNWTTYTNGQGETATIASNQLQLYLPDSVDSYVYIVNNNYLPSGSFEYNINLNSYTPNSTTDGFRVLFRLMEGLTYGASNNAVELRVKQTAVGNFSIQMASKVAGVDITLTAVNITTKPEEIKIIKSNNTFYIYYYDAGSWFLVGSREFGSYADNIIYNILLADDTNLRGGTALLDTLIITSPGTASKISGITTIPYVHNVVDDDEYIYNITAANTFGESDESEEVFGSPTLLTIPQNPSAVAGLEEVTVSWDSVVGATGYNIYWDTSPGVTKLSNKIEGVTSPYSHQDLGDYTYYYRISATTISGESDLSDEVYADPWYGSPAGPTNFDYDDTVLPDSECTLLWDSMDWTDSYNVYYIKQSELDELIRIKKTTVSYETIMEYGTKLENVTSPLNLIDLTAEDYYFIVVGVNIKGEGIPENVLIVDIKFEGKIFNHTEQMLNRLLQQYRLE